MSLLSIFKRKRTAPDFLNREWVDELAEYNSEVSRGIVHTKEYNELMKKRQKEFDEKMKEQLR